ncbi:MAG: hypothetical protein ACRENX_07550 [Candidatus Dormibacteria bacterium]
MKDQNVPTRVTLWAGGGGLLAMVVVGVILEKYLDLGLCGFLSSAGWLMPRSW